MGKAVEVNKEQLIEIIKGVEARGEDASELRYQLEALSARTKPMAGVDTLALHANQSERQSYTHLPPSQILDLCLACARLENGAYDKIWKPEYQLFMDKLTEKADEYNLQLIKNFDIKGWAIRRVEDAGKCVMVTKQDCPCSDPLVAGCPVLRGSQR